MKDQEPQAIIIIDLGFGDTGKGSITDFLCRELPVHTVVRFNGGGQAGHNIITPDGKHHKFAQFGSGSFNNGVRTYLSRFMLIDPLSMFKEARHLAEVGVSDIFERTFVDVNSVVVTPFHQAINRLKELARGDKRFGTTGTGVSEAFLDHLHYGDYSLLIGDLPNREKSFRKLQEIRQLQLAKLADFMGNLPDTEDARKDLCLLNQPQIKNYVSTCSELYEFWVSQVKIVDDDFLAVILKTPGTVIFEGAQGILLDRRYGFYPYVTQSNTTSENADQLLLEQKYQGQITRLGLTRTYATRHGLGPFITEDSILTETMQDLHNNQNPWQGLFRIGYLDLVMLQYALDAVGKIDALAVTHLDRLKELPEYKAAFSYTTASGEILREIKIKRPVTNTYQQNLTRLLGKCTPNYEAFGNNNIHSYALSLEERTDLPIAILSFGPSATNKEWFNQKIKVT